jgi:hypothetical protein
LIGAGFQPAQKEKNGPATPELRAMPAATDKIPEKVPFNVYGMLIILTFLFTGGACWLLGDDLSKNWKYFDNKEEMAKNKKAVHITTINDNPEQYPDNFKLTAVDKEEYEFAFKSAFKKDPPPLEKDFEWPGTFDPLKYSVKFNQDNLHSDTDPEREKQSAALMAADPLKDTVSAETPKEPPKEKPPEEKKP